MTNAIQDELAMLVAAEQQRPDAGAEAADRVWSGVQARLDGGPPPASVPPGTPWGVLSMVGAVVAALAFGGWAYTRPADAAKFESLPPVTALASVTDVPVVPKLRAELGGPELLPPAAESPAREPRSATRRPREHGGTVADELALIERARTAVDRGQVAAALGVLRTHRRRFPEGAFVEEAAALRASALCQSGKVDAAAKASEAFLRRYPKSVHRSRVEACRG